MVRVKNVDVGVDADGSGAGGGLASRGPTSRMFLVASQLRHSARMAFEWGAGSRLAGRVCRLKRLKEDRP